MTDGNSLIAVCLVAAIFIVEVWSSAGLPGVNAALALGAFLITRQWGILHRGLWCFFLILFWNISMKHDVLLRRSSRILDDNEDKASNHSVSEFIGDDGNCRFCMFPKYCYTEHNSIEVSSSAIPVLEKLSRASCGLREVARDGSTYYNIQHNNAVLSYDEMRVTIATELPEQGSNIFAINVADPTVTNDSFSAFRHMPHYMQAAMITSLRSMLHVVKSKSLNQSSYTLLSLDHMRRSSSEDPWFEGLQEISSRAMGLSPPTYVAAKTKACFNGGILSNCAKWRFPLDEKWSQSLENALKIPHDKTRILVGIMNRPGNRELLCIDKLREMLSTRVINGMLVSVFDNIERKTFSPEQASTIASLDVLIASHGAGLSNTIFMKPGALVVEVKVFGYPNDFKYMTEITRTTHKGLIAPPHIEVLKECMINESTNRTKEEVLNQQIDFVKSNIIKRRFDPSIISNTCARSQQLACDAGDIVTKIETHFAGKKSNI